MESVVGETVAPAEPGAVAASHEAATCVGCGRPLATVLEQLGSLRCHDCRDDARRDDR